jgi:hypothetical protein
MISASLDDPKLRKLSHDKPPEAELQETLNSELRRLRKRYGKKSSKASDSDEYSL